MKRDRKGNDTVTIELPVSDRFMREISFLSRKWGVDVPEFLEMCLMKGVDSLEQESGVVVDTNADRTRLRVPVISNLGVVGLEEDKGEIGEQKVKETP